MTKQRSLCPICHVAVRPTRAGHICGHTDQTRRKPCEGSFQPWDLTIAVVPTTGSADANWTP
jgi:hypothetical protein